MQDLRDHCGGRRRQTGKIPRARFRVTSLSQMPLFLPSRPLNKLRSYLLRSILRWKRRGPPGRLPIRAGPSVAHYALLRMARDFKSSAIVEGVGNKLPLAGLRMRPGRASQVLPQTRDSNCRFRRGDCATEGGSRWSTYSETGRIGGSRSQVRRGDRD